MFVNIVPNPWGTLINNNFIAAVNVIVAKARRQNTSVYPGIIVIINILMSVDIVVGINIGQVVVIRMIIAYRAPFGLATNVNA
jgi:hypothetical protein